MSIELTKKVTLQDIAETVGVSVTTVHRALQKKDGISASASHKIHKVAEKLGYHTKNKAMGTPNPALFPAGKNLQSHTIGVLMVDTPIYFLQNRVNVRLLSHLETILARYGMLLSVHQAHSAAELPALVSSDRLDGVIVMGEVTDPVMTATLKNLNAVGVFATHSFQPQWDQIAPDYDVRGRMAAEYLADRGHHRIAYLNHLPEHAGFEMVARAFISQARSLGLEAEEYRADLKEAQTHSQRAVTDRLIDTMFTENADAPTGVHIANDIILHDVYHSLRSKGIRPMEDVDIIGCDNDTLLLPGLTPQPATFDLNLDFIAEKLVESLLLNVQNPSRRNTIGTRTFVPSRLIPASEIVTQDLLVSQKQCL